ncbi:MULTISPECIES: sugar phosphate nucleotidyltransferase [Herbaspirillum]|uniref:NDP-sugar synthase n=2 Tax=Pseudomonadota TaxID=1224 RepID=A0ABU2EFN6_9BURK|nr:MULTISPECIES: NDP-sugar synthase [Herbaspirillum]MAF01594.1 mannose-1-phosphate guanyltransferase [Herbaspirillum sp.]MBO16956.1 mannose-1-phosphate guanyltransferase [Herbaspirillum sp.]MCO4856843.1 NDP-sugar synthase [Herbaspirillum sp. WGmk3]MCP3655013.1 NDP-sugar synthase [Herbaspirillum sp.]MCP3945808.1 NDP-sugar synthase [Herbaspirillum sp.]
MILAAGKGTRVRPLTYALPKPMIPILGKPVMEYLIEHLVKFGIQDIMVNVSYLHDRIENYFGEGQRFGARIGYSFEGYVDDDGQVFPDPIGSAGGMKKIQEFGGFFDETTLVICGDALIDLDIHSALFEHRRKGALVSVITKEVPMEQVSSYGIVVTEPDGKVKSFQEKPKQEEALSNLASTGIYIMEPEALELIPKDKFFDIGSDLFPLLVEKQLPFYAQKRFFNWIDIGNVTDFWSVLQSVLKGEVAQMYVPGTQIQEGVWVGLNTRIEWEGTTIEGPVYIGAGSHIAAGSTIIGPAWIGHGSHICSGAKVIRSVLFEYTRVASGTTFEDSVVYGAYSVTHDGAMKHTSDQPDEQWNDARDRRLKPRTGVDNRST